MNNQQWKAYKDLVNTKLEEYLDSSSDFLSELSEPTRYCVFSGGKRLRPLLAMMTFNMCGGKDMNLVMPFACGVELIHLYSLVHDDLPCMDNDDLRRNQASCHKKFNEYTALLTGSMLTNLAFKIMLSSTVRDSKNIISMITKEISSMLVGQRIDKYSEGITDVSINFIEEMYKKKTGSMLYGSIMCGVMAAGSSLDPLKIRRFSNSLGIAFQIQNDIQGIDKDRDKTTIISVLGLEGTLVYLENLRRSLSYDFCGDSTNFFCEIANYILGR